MSNGKVGKQNMLRLLIAGALLVCGASSGVAARTVAVVSTQHLFEVCLAYKDVIEHPNANYSWEYQLEAMDCAATINGMNTMLNDFSRNGLLKYKICSNHLSTMQIVYQYLNWVSENPTYMGGFASDSFTATMAQYLCDHHPWEKGS
jgi:hypothetical protein